MTGQFLSSSLGYLSFHSCLGRGLQGCDAPRSRSVPSIMSGRSCGRIAGPYHIIFPCSLIIPQILLICWGWVGTEEKKDTPGGRRDPKMGPGWQSWNGGRASIGWIAGGRRQDVKGKLASPRPGCGPSNHCWTRVIGCQPAVRIRDLVWLHCRLILFGPFLWWEQTIIGGCGFPFFFFHRFFFFFLLKSLFLFCFSSLVSRKSVYFPLSFLSLFSHLFFLSSSFSLFLSSSPLSFSLSYSRPIYIYSIDPSIPPRPIVL